VSRRAFSALRCRWKSRQPPGRPALSADIRSLVRRISRENPLWGAPRIDDGLLKLGIQIAQSTVAKASVIWRAIQSAVALAVTLI
jgi:hypothetical protein